MKDIEYIIQTILEYNQNAYKVIKPHLNKLLSLINKDELDKLNLKLEEYLNLKHYLFLTCTLITEGVLTLAPPKNLPDKTLKLREWLKDLKDYNSKGKQGIVFLGTFLDEKIILKKSKASNFLENTLKDYFVGLYCVNNLRMECSMFTFTYGVLTINKGLNEMWIATEYVDGQTLKSLIKSLTFDQFLNIFAQILIALEIGQDIYRFCHYDLHTDNIIIVDSDPQVYHLFKYDIIVKCRNKPVLIDFGMSSILVNDEVYIGQHSNESNGIFPYLSPGYDPYIFLLFSKQLANRSLRDGIDKLFKFYGNINHKNYVNTLKTISNKFTPLLFLEYLKNNFELEMTFKERTKYGQSIELLKPNNILNSTLPSFNIQMSLNDFKNIMNHIYDLDEIDTLVKSSYIILQKGTLGEDFKEWFDKFKHSNLYKNYITKYPEYNCKKRLKN